MIKTDHLVKQTVLFFILLILISGFAQADDSVDFFTLCKNGTVEEIASAIASGAESK